MIGVPSCCSRIVSSVVVSALVAGTVVLAGCGGAAPEPAAPSSPAAKSPDDARTTGEPGSVEEAQAQIAAARAQLGGAGSDSSPNRFAPAPGAAPAAGTSPPPASSPAAPPAADSSTRPSSQDRCGGPCRALSSMRRAVTALCRMTGNDDARCADAKRTLVESEGRIAPCSC